ncbi:MAG: ParA family protein [Proteobacteria bacterium]|nr:ParA family protein [Pseudomonadota bacterium]
MALLNEKGGSAKTTLVANLGAYLALRRGRRVLAIDMDPQGQLGKVLGIDTRSVRRSAIELLLDTVLGDAPQGRECRGDSRGLPSVGTRIPNLDLVVSTKALGLVPAFERDDPDPSGRLMRCLDAAPELDRYDFVLIDSPPSFGMLTLNVLRAIDEVVIPVPLTFLGIDGCAELERTIAAVRTRYQHPELRITMVVPTFYRRTRMAEEVLTTLRQRFPKEIAHSVLCYHVKIDEAQSRGLSIFEYAPNDRGAQLLGALAQELEARAPGRMSEA